LIGILKNIFFVTKKDGKNFIKEKDKMRTTILLLICTLLLIGSCYAEPVYTNEEICESVFIIEGGLKTLYPYGIRSVYCSGVEDCKQICLNTVQNNKVRYAEFGYKKYKTYLEYLSSRYCPITVPGCENWLPNLKFYLNKEK
jgi:hypothetical protein